MRMVLKHVHTVQKKHPNGRVTAYHYAWRGGPRIKAKAGTPEFVAEYNAAIAARSAPKAGTLFGLIAAYKASTDFTTRAEKTKRDYRRYLDLISDKFGTMSLQVVEDRRARGLFKTWRDSFALTPRKADYAWTVLARVLSHAKDSGVITTNVCERGGRIYESDRRDKIWLNSDIDALARVASPQIALVMMMGLWTGQREGDLLRLPWSAYDGKYIRLRQGKTKKRVTIPVGQPLREVLDALPRHGPFATILRTTRSSAWTEDGFRTSWGKACARAEIGDLTFHDLRGTAVTRLSLAGCTPQQIATLTGHSLTDVNSILDANYLSRDVELAEMAIKKLERRERRTRTVKSSVK